MNVIGIVEVIDFEEVTCDRKIDDIRGNIMKVLEVEKPMQIRYRLGAGGFDSASNSVSEASLSTTVYSPEVLSTQPSIPSSMLSRTRSGAQRK